MYGCRDEPIYIQHDHASNDIDIVLSVRFSMIDFTKEIMLNQAQKVFNKLHMREFLNRSLQNQFFSEREKKLISFRMHKVMRNLKRNVSFD